METLRTVIDSACLAPLVELPIGLQNRKVVMTLEPFQESEENKSHLNKIFTQEELQQLLLQCPVADEETIQLQNEIRKGMERWGRE